MGVVFLYCFRAELGSPVAAKVTEPTFKNRTHLDPC